MGLADDTQECRHRFSSYRMQSGLSISGCAPSLLVAGAGRWRLLTFYWAEYYGSGILPPQDWPYKTWLAMIHTHENTGIPSPREVARLLQTAKEKMPHARVTIGRLSDFHDLLVKEDPKLPVITGDMPDTWIHGYLSDPRETRICKHLAETYNTEILNAQLAHWGAGVRNIGPYIDEAIEGMVLYEEHTFGAALSHGNQHKWTIGDEFKINKSLGHYGFLEGTWTEKSNRIRRARRLIVPLMHQQLKQLAALSASPERESSCITRCPGKGAAR